MSDNSIISQFSSEFEAEIPATRKCVERIPENLFAWKPHEKSMNLGYLFAGGGNSQMACNDDQNWRN
jgi:hypothetical protein